MGDAAAVAVAAVEAFFARAVDPDVVADGLAQSTPLDVSRCWATARWWWSTWPRIRPGPSWWR